VTIVVPFTAGSITDGLARILADKLGDMWKQPVIVENRPGIPGTTSAAKAAPDGYTLMLTSNGHTIARAISKSVQFDPVKDFVGISQVAVVPLAVVVPADSPVKSIKEFIALANEKPGQLNFASAGLASTTYLAAEVFKQQAKINIQHVPYRGLPEATTAVVRGDVAIYFLSVPSAQELSATGKLRVLAVNSAKRLPQLPDAPTLVEAGVPGYKYDSWFGVMAPAGTPKPILEKLNKEMKAAVEDPQVKKGFETAGAETLWMPLDQVKQWHHAEIAKYRDIITKAGIEKIE
jgi:tripartite-type tricarboxylate transporter receptor subunit TctC